MFVTLGTLAPLVWSFLRGSLPRLVTGQSGAALGLALAGLLVVSLVAGVAGWRLHDYLAAPARAVALEEKLRKVEAILADRNARDAAADIEIATLEQQLKDIRDASIRSPGADACAPLIPADDPWLRSKHRRKRS